MRYFLTFVSCVFLSAYSISQNFNYSSLTIPSELIDNANAVVRSSTSEIFIESSREMTIKIGKVVTVLNSKGNRSIDAYVHYDKGITIKALEAVVYDNLGNQIKKIKKSDFKDVSAVDGGTLYSDSRVKYLEYTPITYPYTIEFRSEVKTTNTAFIPSFYPVDDYYLSVQKSSYVLNYPVNFNIRKKEKIMEGIIIENNEKEGQISYTVKNIEAIEPEEYSPPFKKIVPKILFALQDFSLEGVEAEVTNWNDFGKWMYNDLIKSTHDLPQSTIDIARNMVKNEETNLDKARKIYQYVQDKTRYISVQVGIGGWKPFNTSDVDNWGYGDCKALTNYTMALLNAVGVESYYTVLYAGNSKESIEPDFASMQGNHVILNLPQENGENVWLECTSQKIPFGFIGDFTDDRDVLVVSPEGGKIVHTKEYTTEENTQNIKGSYTLSNNGSINAIFECISKGIQYDNKYLLESETKRDLDIHYKKRLSYINNININEMRFENDKKNIVFKEQVEFTAQNYTKPVGNRMFLTVNTFNRNKNIPDRYRNRKLPFQILRGFTDVDEVEISLPDNYIVESQFENTTIENKFGKYHIGITQKNENTLIYKRQFIVKDGEYPKEDYNTFREFYKEVARLDNSKIVLLKK